MCSEKLRLPPGYRLDRSDPDVCTLWRPEGWVVAHFSARGATKKAIEEAAWEGHEREEDPRLRPSLQGLLVGRGQVSHQDLLGGRTRPGGDLLSATGQREH